MSNLSSTRKSVDNHTVPKNWEIKYPNKTHTQESLKWRTSLFLHENLEIKVRLSEEHLFQIWCLYLFYKESYDRKTDSMSFLEIYDVLH